MLAYTPFHRKMESRAAKLLCSLRMWRWDGKIFPSPSSKHTNSSALPVNQTWGETGEGGLELKPCRSPGVKRRHGRHVQLNRRIQCGIQPYLTLWEHLAHTRLKVWRRYLEKSVIEWVFNLGICYSYAALITLRQVCGIINKLMSRSFISSMSHRFFSWGW